MNILDIPMEENDSGADTIRGYLVHLLSAVWTEGEDFNGKRPFGNSGWEHDLYAALGKAGAITVVFDEEGWIDEITRDERIKARKLIADAIRSMR